MAITNTALAQAMSDLIAHWQDFQDEHQAWLTGEVGGGPNSDGKYPLTDYEDNTILVTCPAQLEEDVESLVTGAQGYADDAEASATAAAASASTATTQAGLAATARTGAETAETNAETAQAAAETARNTAIAQASAASASAAAALASENAAELAETNAETAEVAAEAAQAAAEAAQAAAEAAESAAQGYAASINPALLATLADNEVISGAWRWSQTGHATTPPIRVGTNADAFTSGGSTLVGLAAAGAALLAVRDETNNIEAFLAAGTTKVTLGSVTNHGVGIFTNNTEVLTFTSAGVPTFAGTPLTVLANAALININSQNTSGGWVQWSTSNTVRGYFGNGALITGGSPTVSDIALRAVSGGLFFSGDNGTTTHFKVSSVGSGEFAGACYAPGGFHATGSGVQSTLQPSSGGGGITYLGSLSNHPVGILVNASQYYTLGSSFTMHVYGAGTLTTNASGVVSATSDERMKDVISPFNRGLDAITRINPIRYRWNEASQMADNEIYAGFSAQDVRSAIPEAVGVTPNKGHPHAGMLTLQDRPILAALVNAVKELNERIEQLEAT
jgi:hypothetical protein